MDDMALIFLVKLADSLHEARFDCGCKAFEQFNQIWQDPEGSAHEHGRALVMANCPKRYPRRRIARRCDVMSVKWEQRTCKSKALLVAAVLYHDQTPLMHNWSSKPVPQLWCAIKCKMPRILFRRPLQLQLGIRSNPGVEDRRYTAAHAKKRDHHKRLYPPIHLQQRP
eukprot:1242534-Amphidinium_carterae.1